MWRRLMACLPAVVLYRAMPGVAGAVKLDRRAPAPMADSPAIPNRIDRATWIAGKTGRVILMLEREGFRQEAFELTPRGQPAATTGTELHVMVWNTVKQLIARRLRVSRPLAAALRDLDRSYQVFFRLEGFS